MTSETRIIKRLKHRREDGYLAELFSERYGDFKCAHSYILSIRPDGIRARHYHKKKTEVMAVVSGEVEITVEDPNTKKRTVYRLNPDDNAENCLMVLVPPGIPHAVKNSTKQEVRVVVFADTYDLEDTMPYDFGVPQ